MLVSRRQILLSCEVGLGYPSPSPSPNENPRSFELRARDLGVRRQYERSQARGVRAERELGQRGTHEAQLSTNFITGLVPRVEGKAVLKMGRATEGWD